MANMCNNTVTFNGPPSQIGKVFRVFEKMEEISSRNHLAQRFLLIEKNEDLHYFFDVYIEKADSDNGEDGYLSFSTRWSPDPKQFMIIAQMFGIAFHYEAEEMGCGIYCAYKYDPEENILYERDLTDKQLSQSKICDEHGSTHPDESHPDCSDTTCDLHEDWEELETLLSKEEWKVSQFQIPIL